MEPTMIAHSLQAGRTLRSLISLSVLALSLFLTATGQSHAATYYVDISHPQASDSNPGTEVLPWKTLYRAADPQGTEIVAGDTVLVKDGNYDASGGTWTTPAIRPANAGEPGNPITFKVYPGHQAILTTGADQSAIGSNRDYVVIDGFTIAQAQEKGITVFGTGAHRIKGVVIQNNTIHNVKGPGGNNTEAIRIEHATGVIARKNLIFDVHNTNDNQNATGFKFFHTDNLLIENNEISDVIQGIFDKDDGNSNVFRFNYIHDCRRGISTWSNNGNTIINAQIHNNIVTRCNVNGIAVMGSLTGSPNKNARVFNNTLTDSGEGIRIETDVENVQVWNNIIYSAGSGNLVDSNPSISFCDFNLYFLTPSGLCGVNSITDDPEFINTAFLKPDDFKLQASSPAKGVGKTGEDIGAYATGSECIGLESACVPDNTPPASPTGLTIK